MTIGRNDPCPCGSGKKYKRCCLPSHDVISLQVVRENNLTRDVWDKLTDFLASEAPGDDPAMGYADFFLDPEGEYDDEATLELAADWVAFAYVTDGGDTLCERLAASGKGLSAQERELLRDWGASSPGFFRVETADGAEHQLRRLPDGRTFPARAPDVSLHTGDVLSAWLLPGPSTYGFGYVVQHIGQEALEPLMHLAKVEMELLRRQRPAATWEELYRLQWPRIIDALSMAVADGAKALQISAPPGPAVLETGAELEASDIRWRAVALMIMRAAETLDDWLGPEDLDGLRRLWQDAVVMLRPNAVRPGGWAAAVIYVYLRDILGDEVTQSELAEWFDVSPGTVGSHSREIAKTLRPTQMDPRYVDLMDPLMRMEWRVYCLRSMGEPVEPD